MLAGPIDLQIQRRVVPTLPMQDHLDEAAFDAHTLLARLLGSPAKLHPPEANRIQSMIQ